MLQKSKFIDIRSAKYVFCIEFAVHRNNAEVHKLKVLYIHTTNRCCSKERNDSIELIEIERFINIVYIQNIEHSQNWPKIYSISCVIWITILVGVTSSPKYIFLIGFLLFEQVIAVLSCYSTHQQNPLKPWIFHFSRKSFAKSSFFHILLYGLLFLCFDIILFLLNLGYFEWFLPSNEWKSVNFIGFNTWWNEFDKKELKI